MKMIFGAFNNYDIELPSYKIFCDYLLRTLSQFALKLKNFEKNSKKNFKKSQLYSVHAQLLERYSRKLLKFPKCTTSFFSAFLCASLKRYRKVVYQIRCALRIWAIFANIALNIIIQNENLFSII